MAKTRSHGPQPAARSGSAGARGRGFLSRNLDFDGVTQHAVQGVSQGDGKDGSQQIHVKLQVAPVVDPVHGERASAAIVGSHQIEGQAPSWNRLHTEMAAPLFPLKLRLAGGHNLQLTDFGRFIRRPQQA